MQAIKKGQLFQYTQEHYGKFYPELPKVPFSSEYRRFKTSCRKDVKKYTLLAAKSMTVHHPRTEAAKCEYVLCFISDPYQDGETMDGWVRAEWIEPLTAFQTYEAEELNALYDLFKEMKEQRDHLLLERELTPLEDFQRAKEQKR